MDRIDNIQFVDSDCIQGHVQLLDVDFDFHFSLSLSLSLAYILSLLLFHRDM